MNIRKKSIAFILILASLTLLWGCLDMMTRQSGSVEIIKPDSVFVSPNFDFNKVSGLGIFPIFPAEIENPNFADAFSRAFTAELQMRQSQWKIIPSSELVAEINRRDLGRGYKNLQADMNTFSGSTGFGAMTQETKKFLKDLNNKIGTDAFLMGIYSIGRQSVVQQTLFGPQQATMTICRVKLILYEVDKGIMWDATHTVQTSGTIENNADPLAKSFAAYLGKGTLRQL